VEHQSTDERHLMEKRLEAANERCLSLDQNVHDINRRCAALEIKLQQAVDVADEHRRLRIEAEEEMIKRLQDNDHKWTQKLSLLQDRFKSKAEEAADLGEQIRLIIEPARVSYQHATERKVIIQQLQAKLTNVQLELDQAIEKQRVQHTRTNDVCHVLSPTLLV
jgi:hypothetical protein